MLNLAEETETWELLVQETYGRFRWICTFPGRILGFHSRDETAMLVQKNNGKMSLKFCIIMKSNSQNIFPLLFCTTTWPPWRQGKTENNNAETPQVKLSDKGQAYCKSFENEEKLNYLTFLSLLNLRYASITAWFLTTSIRTNCFPSAVLNVLLMRRRRPTCEWRRPCRTNIGYKRQGYS